jgi:hypothetical protein
MKPRPFSQTLLFLLSLLVACGGGGGASPDDALDPRQVVRSVSVVTGVRLAASSEGLAWLVWGEGDLAAASVSAAAVDRSGGITRSTVSASTPGTVRDIQIDMSSTGPIVAWRSYSASATDVRVHVSAYAGGRWSEELSAPASHDGAPQLIVQPDGVSVMWQRVGSADSSELVFARRSNDGRWAAPVVVASTPSGIDMGLARHAAAADGSIIAIWTEAPVAATTAPQPQVLMASRYDPSSDTWGTATPVDSANGLYYSYDVIANATGEWLAVWVAGTPSRQPALLSRRWYGAAWADPERIDEGDDDTIREVTLARGGRLIHLVWTGLSAAISPGNVRASAFDTVQPGWSRVNTLGRAETGYPQRPTLASSTRDEAVVIWEVTQSGGNGGPFVAARSPTAGWGTGRLLNEDGVEGYVGDLALPSANEAIALWYRFGPQGLVDLYLSRWSPLNQ